MALTEPTAESTTEKVAAELRAVMARKRLTQMQLAILTGKNQMWVSRRCSGAVSMSIEDMEILAQAMSVDLWDLLPAEIKTGSKGRPTLRLLRQTGKSPVCSFAILNEAA